MGTWAGAGGSKGGGTVTAQSSVADAVAAGAVVWPLEGCPLSSFALGVV